MYIWILISVILFLWGIIRDKSKLSTFAILIFLFIVFSFNRDTSDYNNYITQYNDIGNGINNGYEPVYAAIMYISSKLGLEYSSFKILVSFIQIAVLYFGISKITPNTAIVVALYLIFPAYLDGFHTRFSIGSFVVIAALLSYFKKMVLQKDLILSTVTYLFFVMIATLIHSSLLFFAFIPLIFFLARNTFCFWKVTITTVAVFGILFVFRFTGLLPTILQLFFGFTQKLDIWAFTGTTGITLNGIKIIIKYGAIQAVRLSFVFLLYTVNAKYSKIDCIASNNTHNENLEKEKYLQFILLLNVLAFIVVIFQTYTVNFERLYRVIDLLNYVGVAICISSLHPRRAIRFGVKSLAFSYSISFALIYYLASEFYIEAYKLVFSNNIFFNSLLGR